MKRTTRYMKRWMLMLALCASAGAAQAQVQSVDARYTLTNGRLYWYDNNEWENGNMRYRYDVAFDENNSWAEIHPFGGLNVSLITEQGEVYLKLDLSGATPAIVSTAAFDPYCVWSRTGNTGYYYQLWEGYYYYLVGSSTGLRLVKVAVNAPNDDNSYWYDWDYGAAVQEQYFDGDRVRNAYYWMMYDTTGTGELDGNWNMSCNSYQRPEDAIYAGYDYSLSREQNNLNRHFYCTRTVNGVRIPAGNGALFMPVTLVEHDRQLSTIPSGLGLQDLVIHKGGAPVSTNFAMRYLDEVEPVVTVNESAGNVVGVINAYTEYVEETYRYGINRDYQQRSTETFGSAGVPTYEHHYYYGGIHNTTPPSEVMGPLQVASYSYSFNNAARRYLSVVVGGHDEGGFVEGVAPGSAVSIVCRDVPPNGATATLTVTVTYTNGATQSRSVNILMSQELDDKPLPEPTHGPVIGGSVFGGGRMANVGGNTNITVHSADSIYALYGGNDIAGWVQGDDGANITLGTEKTDADHPVHIGYVYGGGCGFYTYRGINFGVDANNVPDIYPYDFGATDFEKVNTSLMYQSYYFNGEVYPWRYQPKGEKWNPNANGGQGAWEPYTPANYPTILPEDTAGLHWNWERDEGGADQRVTKAVFYYDPLYSNPNDVDNNETGNHGNGTIPYIKTAHITVGVPEVAATPLVDANGDSTKVHNDFILIDSLFGGAENAFIGVTADKSNPANGVTLDVNGGTIFSLFGGNNYGGSVANTSTVFVNIHDTKQPPAGIAHDPSDNQSFFSGYGRDYGIRYAFGGGNKVAGSHASVNITGGMIDTLYLGGNQATVDRPVGTINCEGEHFLCTNGTYPDRSYFDDPANFDLSNFGVDNFETETGRYNIRCLFGGNNSADMNTLSVIQLYSGGISCVYGGGNRGDMNNTSTTFVNPIYASVMAGAFAAHPFIPAPTGIGSIVSALKDSRIVCDYVFGGCKMSNVKASSGVYLSGGIFGYVNGGNDVSGDVGSTTGDFTQGHTNGTYVFLDSNALVIGDLNGGSDGYYHCDDGTGHYDNSELIDTYSGLNYDPYDLYSDPLNPILLPTHNNTNVAIKGGTVLGNVIGGGVHSNVGFADRANKIRLHGIEEPLNPVGGVRHGSIHLSMLGGHVMGNVYGGGYLSSIYGLSYLHVGGTTQIDGSLYAGNDLKGSIENFGAYTSGVQDADHYRAFLASNGDSLNSYDGSWNARYSTYLKLDGSPRINTVYGSGNGNYDYDSIASFLCDEGNSVPLQPSTFIDINTTGGFIDTVFGGGNGVGVRDAVKVLFNSTQNQTLTVGTIFGGNNSEDMITCVPNIELKKGRVKNVFGGGNAGRMRGFTTLTDICGNQVEGVSSYVRVENTDAIVEDTIFGGCRKAAVTGIAYVDIRDGEVNTVYGGNDISDTIHGNTRIDVSGGTVAHIYGGSNGRYDYEFVGNRWDAFVFGSNHGEDDTVALGTSGRPFVDSTTINLYGGVINTSVYGGGSLGDCRATLVEVNDQICQPNGTPLALTITGDIFGGGEGNADDLNWHASDGKRHGNVVSNDNGAGATHVNLRHATNLATAQAYGGGRGGDVENTNITVYPTWDIPFSAIYGGCWGSDVTGTANLTLHGSTATGDVTAENVFGGNDFTGNVYCTRINVESGTFGNIYGGGNGTYADNLYTSDAYEGNYTSGTYAGRSKRIYAPNNEFAEVNFLDGVVTGNLYGGGKQGTTMRLKRDNNQFVTFGGASKEADTSMAYADLSHYSHILLNIKGGNFQSDVYGGGAGVVNGNPIVYALKQINMENGLIHESLHGGSENVSDGYGQECVSTTNTTMRPSSITNITGGTLQNHVYGAGYLGDVYGSVYINIGQAAVDSCPVWTKTINGQPNAYALYKPGAAGGYVGAMATNELQLQASIYGGADWGSNVGSADFSKQGFFGGESRIAVDGEGYNTYMDVDHENLPLMNIANSIIGSGTSAEGGDVYNRVDVRNYGAISSTACKPTREIRAIQRAKAVWLENTAIGYTGSTDAISAYLSSQYTINRVDTLNCVGYNVLDIKSKMTNIKNVNFLYSKLGTADAAQYHEYWPEIPVNYYEPSHLAYVEPALMLPSDHCDPSASLCDQFSWFRRAEDERNGVVGYSMTSWVINNGINVDILTEENGQYGAVKGFGYILAEQGTNAVITARPKYGPTNADDGGFWSLCSDSMKAVESTDQYDITWCNCDSYNYDNEHCYEDGWIQKMEYEYNNYGSQYRVWSTGEGVRRRYSVVLAHNNPDLLYDDDSSHMDKRITLRYNNPAQGIDSLYNFAIAKAKLVLPPTSPGHYYKISQSGVTINDENDEVQLVDMSYLPKNWGGLDSVWHLNAASGAKPYNALTDADKQEPADHGDFYTLTPTEGGSVTGLNYIYNRPNGRQYFGLMMSSGTNFARYQAGDEIPAGYHVGDLVPPAEAFSNPNWSSATTLSGNAYTNMVSNFTTAQVGAAVNASPELDLYMLYNSNFSHTVAGTVTFTLEEYDETGRNIMAPIEVELTLSTVIQEFNDLEYNVLAMYNEGRNNTFTRKVILPATLQRRELYLKSVSWFPTDKTTGNGDTLRTASNPNYFFLTGDTNAILNQPGTDHSWFAFSIEPTDNVTNNLVTSAGWHEKSLSEPLDIFTAVGQSGEPSRAFQNMYYQEAGESPAHQIGRASAGAFPGRKIGTLDGRSEASIDVHLHYDGKRVYDYVTGKGIIGKVVLNMVSFAGGDYSHPNEFNIIIDLKTRESGDTIYMATPTAPHSILLGGIPLTEGTDFTSPTIGKHPNEFVASFYDALTKIYEEGDVIAIIGEVDITAGATLIKGSVDMPIPVIRYTGTHSEAPGEACVYRGPMVSVSGTGTVFTARGIDFQGSMLNKVRPTVVDHADLTAFESDGVHKRVYDRLRGQDDNLWADTTRAFGPIIAVKNNATVNLQNGIIVEQNHNGYNGDDPQYMGAISVTNGGTLTLSNNVTIRNNISDSLTMGGDLTPWRIHPRNGAVYVDGGHISLQQSTTSTAVNIQRNYLNQTGAPYWEEHRIDVGSVSKLLHYDVNSTEYNLASTRHTKANVLLARAPVMDGVSDVDMRDSKSAVITFNYAIPKDTRIGVSKWFPDVAEIKRDTIQIAYQADATHIVSAINNGNFTSDDDYFVFYNYGVNNQRIYMGRCASFRFQQATTPVTYLVNDNVATGDATAYSPLVTATCPTGGDTLFARVQGGFFPYTYKWNDVTHGTTTTHNTTLTNSEIRKQVAMHDYSGLRSAVYDTMFTTHIDMGSTETQSNLIYHLTVNDATGNCALTKKIKVKVVKDMTDAPVEPFVKASVPGEMAYDAWTDLLHSGPNQVCDTARGTRTYKGVRITPMVWTPGAGTITASATVGGDPNIYIGTPSNPNPINNLSFCEGDILEFATTPAAGYKFVMWDFDPYYSNPSVYVVPSHSATVVAYFAPETYWKDVVTTTAIAGAAHATSYYYNARPTVPSYTLLSGDGTATSTEASYVTTYSGDVHIYNENGLAWLISVVNGLHGHQVRPFYFNHVYIHKKDDGTDYDMKNYLWTPMGTLQYGFRGMFTGVGSSSTTTTPLAGDDRVVIKNLIIEEPEMTHVGFFASLDSAIVTGIELQSVMAHGGQYVGGFAAKSTYSTFDNCAVLDDAEFSTTVDAADVTTSILTTHYASGGFLGKSEHDVVTNSVIEAKFVGNAVYSGGAVGYGTATTISNTPVINVNGMSALYQGGLAGYLDGVAPVSRLFRAKTAEVPSYLANNYVRIVNHGRPHQLGGLVGSAQRTVMENNYVFGDMNNAEASAGVASQMSVNARADHNYYAATDVKHAVNALAGGAVIADTSSFHGSGNRVALDQPVYGISNLTRALNIWVRAQNAAGHHYKTWRSDLEGVNSGYPVYGQPDLIPVRDTVNLDGCEEVEWLGDIYRRDITLQGWVIDSALMVDSMLTVNIRIHHGSHIDVADSVLFGQNYSGYGFTVSAAAVELLRATVDSAGSASIVLTDTLHTAFGCDSIVSLTLTFVSDSVIPDTTTGIDREEVEKVPEIKVYPNPTTELVNVETEGLSHVEIYDNEGRRLSDYEAHGQPKVTLDVSKKAAGVYYIRIHTVHGVTIQKIIKQ